MNGNERCVICGNRISGDMDICPHCGCIIDRKGFRGDITGRYNFDRVKNLEYLERMEITLCHLEEELDAFLCKKR